MAKCYKCGKELKRNSFRFIHVKNGRKFRVHYSCYSGPALIESETDILSIQTAAKTPSNRVEQGQGRPPVTDPRPIESFTPDVHYYLTTTQVNRLKEAAKRPQVLPVTVMIYIVPNYQVEQNPEEFADLVEIELKDG